jgi:hypothetical protein
MPELRCALSGGQSRAWPGNKRPGSDVPILRWIASKPRRNIHFEVFHVAQGDSNLAASVIVAVVSGHFHMIPLGWRGASPNSLRAACAVADGMDSLGDLIEIPQGLLVPAYLAIALPAYTPLNTNSSEWRALEERFFVW